MRPGSQPGALWCLCDDAFAGKPRSYGIVSINRRGPVGARLAREEALTNAKELQPLQRRHQVIQPIHLIFGNVARRQPVDVFGQLCHRAALEHRP